MKKRLVTVGLAMITAIILLIAGCGEGKNYIEMSYYCDIFLWTLKPVNVKINI